MLLLPDERPDFVHLHVGRDHAADESIMQARAAFAEQHEEVEDRLLMDVRQPGCRVDRAAIDEVRGNVDATREGENVRHREALAYLGRVGHPRTCRRRAAQPLGSGPRVRRLPCLGSFR